MSMLGKRGLCRHDPHTAFAHRGKEKVTRLDDVAIWARTLQRLKDGARAVFTASASLPSSNALPATAPIQPPVHHPAQCPARPVPVGEFALPAATPSAGPSILRHWWQPAAVGQQRRAEGQAGRAGAGGGLGGVSNSVVRACCCGDGGVGAHSGGACMRCSHALCSRCTCVCAACNQLFCDNCTVTNYDLRMDRFFCLDCSHHHC